MQRVENTVYSINTSHRPFRRYRPTFNLNFVINKFQSFFDKPLKVAKSPLGTLVTYAVAETVGSMGGQKIGELALGTIVSKLGQNILMTSFTGGIVLGAYSTAMKSSRMTQRLFYTLACSSAILINLSCKKDVAEIGAEWGGNLGNWIGGSLGIILGGYSALAIVKSPIKLIDSENSRDSYLVSMVRFILAGLTFDTVVSKATVPFIAPLCNIPRLIIKSMVQTFAYNSNIFFHLLKDSLREKRFSQRTQIPLLIEMFANTYCGHNKKALSKELTKSVKSTISFLPAFLSEEIASLKQQARSLTAEILFEQMDKLPNASALLANATIRSLTAFIRLLKNTESINLTHQNFQTSFFQNNDLTYTKQKLMEALENEVFKGHSALTATIVNKLNEKYLKKVDPNTLELIISKIRELEVSAFGIPVIGEKNAAFLKEIMGIYLPYFVVFTLINFSKNKHELTPLEEQAGLLELNKLLFSYYFNHATPRFISRPLQFLMNLTIQTAYKTQNIFTFITVQSEQSTCLVDEPEKVNQEVPNYFEYREVDVRIFGPIDAHKGDHFAQIPMKSPPHPQVPPDSEYILL